MTDSFKSIFKKRVHIALVFVVLVSLYLTGFIDTIIDPKFNRNIGFGSAVLAIFQTTYSLYIFPIAFLLIAGLAIFLLHKSWKDGLLDDKMGRAFKYSQKISPYGDAHAMEPHEYKDVAQIRKLEDCKGIIVGQLTENGEECIDFNAKRINTHMYVVAMSGSGKTFGFVKPYIFQSVKRRHSLVVTDPKGELFQDTAGFLQDNGYHVRRLDFKNLDKSDGWDCLKLLRGENMRTKVQIFSNAAISNINPNDNSIFAKGSDSLLQALILRVLLGHDFSDKEKNIKSVYQMLQNPAGYEFLDQMFDKNSLTEDELPCLPPFLAYKQGSANLSANIATHLANGLQLFQDELLCDVLSTDDIDLILPGEEPCAYFCVFPDDHDTYRFIISLFFTMFFIELVDHADAQPGLRLPVPVDFLLDEFPSIGIIPDWAKKMSTIRSRGISAVMITQDFTQLKQNYRDTWATILNNCGALITLGINEMETADWISKRIGETSIEVESTSQTKVAGQKRTDLVKKDSIGVGKRALFTSSEIFEIGQDNNLVVIAGRNPIFSKKTPYTIFPQAKLLRSVVKDSLIDINDRDAKRVFRECENNYIKQYWSTHNPKPVGDPWDLSDALYTEEGQDPVSMVMDVLKEDFHSIKSVFKKKDRSVPIVPASEEKEGSAEKQLTNALAEKGAFLEYYNACKDSFAATVAEEDPVGIDIPDFVIDDETGDVKFVAGSSDDSFDIFRTAQDHDLEIEEDTDVAQKPGGKAAEPDDEFIEEPVAFQPENDPPAKKPRFNTSPTPPAKKNTPVFDFKDDMDVSQSSSKGFTRPPSFKKSKQSENKN